MKLPKEFTLNEIAAVVGGKVIGPGDLKVSFVAPSPLSAQEGQLALVFEPKLLKRLDEIKASAVIVPEGVQTDRPRIEVKRPLLALQKMLSALQPKRSLPEGAHPSAIVDPSAQLGEAVGIGPGVIIGKNVRIGRNTRISAGCIIGDHVVIGEDCLFFPGCLIADYVQIGNRVILQQGAAIGSDGYAYVTERPSNIELRMAGKGVETLSDEPNLPFKIPQIGTVIVEDDVEIGSNATIDRATIGATIIGAGTKIDNLVMIAHNVRIGREVLIMALSAVGGSTVLGDRAVVAGHVGVKDHMRIGKDAILEASAGVMRDVADTEVVCGAPALPAREYFNILAHGRKAPQLHQDVRELKKRVSELEALLRKRELVAGGAALD